MKPPEQQTLVQRIVLTMVIVVVILIVLSFIGWISGRWDEAPAQAYTSRPEWDARMIELDRQALEQAYQQHLILVWTNWLKDAGPPTRHQVGFKRARDGFIASMIEIEKRERGQ